jgi:hypothetical protein
VSAKRQDILRPESETISSATHLGLSKNVRRTLMLMMAILGCILVASLATAGLIASAQNAQDQADEAFSITQTEVN